jgi:hypothetical protein
MKKLILLLWPVFLIACHTTSSRDNNKQLAIVDTIRPKIDVKVNKQFDDKGNVIRYDSSYSYYYFNPGKMDSLIGTDSIYGSFKNWYFNNYNRSFNNQYHDIFFTDSLFKYDLFNEDFFQKRFDLNMNRMRKMYQQMDSVKNEYFHKTYPEDGKLKKLN